MNKHSATVLNFHSSLPARSNEKFDEDSRAPTKQHFLVLVQESEIAYAGQFFRFLSSFRPQVILDLRLAPRLDFVGGSRMHTFRAFHQFSVQYIDVFGRLGVLSRDDFLSLKFDEKPTLMPLIDADATDDRPLVCLFGDPTVLDRCEEVFRCDIESYIQQRPSTSVSRFRSGLLAF